MTSSQDPWERLCAANPLPRAVEPDWELVREHFRRGSQSDAEGGVAGAAAGRGRSRRRPSWLREDGAREAGRRGRHPARTVVGASAVGVLVAAGALLLIASWSSSPDFLARAAAGMTPGPEMVLYEKWEETVAARSRGGGSSSPAYPAGPNQLWVDGRAPYAYRAILQPHADSMTPTTGGAIAELVGTYGSGSGGGDEGPVLVGRVMPALAGGPLEIGGALERGGSGPRSEDRDVYVPSDEVWKVPVGLEFGSALTGGYAPSRIADPAGPLREALADGRAHEAGTSELEGQAVVRIDFDPPHPPADAPPLPADAPAIHMPYAYVEPETLHPVEIVAEGATVRFLAYEYLPDTAANVALTSVEGQHPNAPIVEEEPGTGKLLTTQPATTPSPASTTPATTTSTTPPTTTSTGG